MNGDWARECLAGVVGRLGADAALRAEVGERIYGGEPPFNPTYPYIHVGGIDFAAYNTDGDRGARLTFTIDVHMEHVGQEDVHRLAALAANSIDRREGYLNTYLTDGYSIARMDHDQTDVFRRGDGTGWDASAYFTAIMDRRGV